MGIDVHWNDFYSSLGLLAGLSGTEFLHCCVLMSIKTMLHLFQSSQTDWIRNVGCSFTCNLPLQYQIFWWSKHFDLLFLWTHIIIYEQQDVSSIVSTMIWISSSPWMDKPRRLQWLPSGCRSWISRPRCIWVTWPNLWQRHNLSSPNMPTWMIFVFFKSNGVSGRAQGVGIHGDDGRPRSPWIESCVASPYLMISDYCLIAKWNHHQHIIWCSLFDF